MSQLPTRDAVSRNIESSFIKIYEDALRGSLHDDDGKWLNPYAMTGKVHSRRKPMSEMTISGGSGAVEKIPHYRTFVEVNSTHPEALRAVKAACAPLIAQITQYLANDGEKLWMAFSAPGYAPMSREEPYALRVKSSMVAGGFIRQWEETTDWNMPTLQPDAEERLWRHGIRRWRVGQQIFGFAASPVLIFSNDSDFVMAKMLF